VLR
jgi:hypothetical protein